MGMWTDYYRIIRPASPKTEYVTDNSTLSAQYSNFSWYSKMLKGATGRFQLYQQVNAMDNDVDVARALDTIAEEMTPGDLKTKLPFEIEYQNDDNQEVDEGIVITLKAALRQWCTLHNLNSKCYDIARRTVKYGDCFFRKTSDTKEWQYIDPLDIIGVALDHNDLITHYQIRKGEARQPGFAPAATVDFVPAAGMVHFSLSSRMEVGPYGESILKPTLTAYKQLKMLEDATIIYRIVRAPERRVFFVDVGNMPPQKIKQYLEGVKNEVKQKRIPSETGGTSMDKVDSAYNPMSMMEDYFFPATANGRGGRVETLPGGENLGEIRDLQWFQQKFFRGLRIPFSYMSMTTSKDDGAVRQDGKVGLAYIEELRFANYITRLQNKIEPVFEHEFKCFLKSIGLKINDSLFKLTLPPPQNFEEYKQAALDNDLLANFANVKEIPWISPRYAAKRYLGWSEDDLQTNESMLRQELAIPEGGIDAEKLSDLRMMYDPNWVEKKPDIKVPDDLYKVDIPELDAEEPPKDDELDKELGDKGAADEGEEDNPLGGLENEPEKEGPTDDNPLGGIGS
jgi:hypothetical protein